MKNIKFNLLGLMAFAALLLFGCSDNNTTNPDPTDDPKDFYKMEVGNYWIYKIDQIDTNATILPNTTNYDSTAVTSSLQYQGKNALKTRHFITNENNEEMEEDIYYSIENSKFFLWADVIGNEQLKVPFNGWLLIADFNGTSWTIFDSTVTLNLKLDDNISGVLNAEVKLIGSKGNKQQISIKNQNHEAQVFNQTLTVKGTLSIGIVPLAIDETLTIKYYFVKGIGLAKVEQSALGISLPVIGAYIIPGRLQMLLDYYVK